MYIKSYIKIFLYFIDINILYPPHKNLFSKLMLKLIIIKFHYYSVTKPKINLCSKDQMLCKIATPLSSTKQPICLSNHPLNNSSNDHIIVTRHDNVCIHIRVYIFIYYTHTAQPRRNPKAREKEKKK